MYPWISTPRRGRSARSAIAQVSELLDAKEPVGLQPDRTGDSIKAMIADMKAFPGAKPVSAEELQRVTDGNIRGLPNKFETNGQVLGAIAANERLGRPDDYYRKLPALYRSIDAKALEAKAAEYLQPEGLTFVVVGDRAKVEAQLKDVGLPVEVSEGK